MSDNFKFVDQSTEEYNTLKDEILDINHNIQALEDQKSIALRKISLLSSIQPGNLVKAKDIVSLDENLYVCSSISVKCSLDNEFMWNLNFFRMRKNSEKSYRSSSYTQSQLLDIQLVDNTKNYLLNNDEYDMSLF